MVKHQGSFSFKLESLTVLFLYCFKQTYFTFNHRKILSNIDKFWENIFISWYYVCYLVRFEKFPEAKLYRFFLLKTSFMQKWQIFSAPMQKSISFFLICYDHDQFPRRFMLFELLSPIFCLEFFVQLHFYFHYFS